MGDDNNQLDFLTIHLNNNDKQPEEDIPNF